MELAVAGAGVMGAHHARVLQEQGHRLRALYDPDPAARAAIPGAAVSCGEPDALWTAGAEALIIAAPTRFHAPLAINALERGLHVLVEKPIASSTHEATRMLQAAADADRVLAVGHVERCNPAWMMAKTSLASLGGKVSAVEAVRTGPRPARIKDVGCILDVAIHDIDLSASVLGQVDDVHAAASWSDGRDVGAQMLLAGPAGSATIHASWRAPVRVRSIHLSTDEARIEADLMRRRVRVLDAHEGPDGEAPWIDAPPANPLAFQLDAFASACTRSGTPVATAQDGLRALALAEAALEAARVAHRPLEEA